MGHWVIMNVFHRYLFLRVTTLGVKTPSPTSFKQKETVPRLKICMGDNRNMSLDVLIEYKYLNQKLLILYMTINRLLTSIVINVRAYSVCKNIGLQIIIGFVFLQLFLQCLWLIFTIFTLTK